MKFKLLDTKWKHQRRLELIIMILAASDFEPVNILHLEAIYDLSIKALDLEWIHPNY